MVVLVCIALFMCVLNACALQVNTFAVCHTGHPFMQSLRGEETHYYNVAA
jgi:hypothetical protein